MLCMLFFPLHIDLDQTAQYHAKLYSSIPESFRDTKRMYYAMVANGKGETTLPRVSH